MIIGIVFLVLGGLFIMTTIKGLFSLMSTDHDEQSFTGGMMFSLFKVPLLCFLLLMIFVIWGIPYLEANNLQ